MRHLALRVLKMPNLALEMVHPPVPTRFIVQAWRALPRPITPCEVSVRDLRSAGYQTIVTSRALPPELLDDAFQIANGSKGSGVRAMLGLYGIEPYARFVSRFDTQEKPIGVSLYLPERYHVAHYYSVVGKLLDASADAWLTLPTDERDSAELAAHELFLGEDSRPLRLRVNPRTFAVCQSVSDGQGASEGARRVLAAVQRHAERTT